jgi:hypothetical protein
MISIEEFCDQHSACEDGRSWALTNCETMQDVWDTSRHDWLVWVATRQGVLDDRTLRLFAVFCARSVEHFLTDQRSRDAIDVAERFANGEATAEELAAAASAAESATAAASAAWAAAHAAGSAAKSAAWAAAHAAGSAARFAAWAAAGSAAGYAVGANQAAWLRKNAKPRFERSVGDEMVQTATR